MMLRRLAAAVFLLSALVVAPAAAADGFGGGALQGGAGVVSPDGTLRYLAVGIGTADWTSLQAVQTSDGVLRAAATLSGSWGIPYIGPGERWSSLSNDGRTLVLAETVPDLRQSRFLVYDPRRTAYRQTVVLDGSFSFDALSPDGSRLYLIEHVSSTDVSRYVVRAYDLRTRRLLPGRIADRTQKSWVMQGYPMARATSADGRMVYTLYQNPGGYPFVHALDTVRGVAHCIGLPLTGSALFNVVLSVHGRTLAVHWRSGRPWYVLDTTTWRLSHAHRSGLPWLWVALGTGLAAAAATVGAALLRRRRREALEHELAGLLRLPEGEPVA